MNPNAQLKTAIERGFDPKVLYSAELKSVKEPIRSILEEQSNIPAEKILAHVQEVVSKM